MAQRLNLDVPSYNENRIVAAYDYTDESGRLLFQVVRLRPKTFRQRRPDPTAPDRWRWDLRGVTPVLYRLPAVLEAVKVGETIFVTEGEKDADNLTALGLCATTCPMGAGKWRDSYSEALAGANAVILPDADEPGRRHARQVATSLYRHGCRVRVLDLPGLPPKGDISDWLAAGGTREELLRLSEEAPKWEPPEREETPSPAAEEEADQSIPCPRIVRLSDVEPEEVSWLWHPYIPLRKITILEGDPGIGKTWLALVVSACVSTGDLLPGIDGKPGEKRDPANVLYMTCEDGLGDTLRPRLDKAGADVSRIYALRGQVQVNPETGREEEVPVWLTNIDTLRAALQEVKPALLVVDPLQGFLGAKVDMHRANEVRPVMAGIAKLAEEFNCAVLLIRHLGKSPQDRAIYRGLGSIDFAAAVRSVLLAAQDPKDPKGQILAHSKASLTEKGPSLRYEIRYGEFLWAGISDLSASDLLRPEETGESRSTLDEAKDFLREILASGPVASSDVLKQAKKAGISEITLRRAKAELKIRVFQDKGKKGNWQWELSDDQDDQETEKPIRADDDHLIKRPQSSLSQGFQGTQSDDQMIKRLSNPQSLEPQGFQGKRSDDHREPLGKGASDDQVTDGTTFIEDTGGGISAREVKEF